MIPFWGKKTKQKQNSATIMISVDGNGLVFPMKLKLQGELFEKKYKKKKNIKIYLNAMSFDMLLPQ